MKSTIIYLFILFWLLAGDDPAREAYEAYRNGDYQHAEQLLRQAVNDNPSDYRLYFNLGNTHVQRGHYEDALRAYRHFTELADAPRERARGHYNAGNVHSQQEQWEEAIAAYRRALRYDAQDEDARHNLELALKRQQEQEDQQQESSGGSAAEQDQRPSGEQQMEPMQDQAQMNRDPSQQPPEQQMELPPQESMNSEDSERMLERVQNLETDLLRQFLERQLDPVEDHEKDW